MNAKTIFTANGRTFRPQKNHVAETMKHKLPAIEDAADLLAEPQDDPPEIIEGLLHQGAKMVIGGGSKSYKTWLLLDLALSVATGTDWLGFAATHGRVLFINLEIQRGFFRKRLIMTKRTKGVNITKGLLDVWNLRGYAADLSQLISEILERVGKRYVLIVVDPIYKALGSRDENKAGDISNLLNEVEKLAVSSDAAVVFGAHFSKGNQSQKESIDRIGGSGVFARDPDSILVLTRHEENGAFTLDATLRNHPPIEPFVVRWQFPLMLRDNELDPAKLKQVGGRTKVHSSDDLLALIKNEELSTAEWQVKADEEAGISRRTFYRLRKELETAKRARKSLSTGKWNPSCVSKVP